MTFYTAYSWNREVKPSDIIGKYSSFNEAERRLFKDCRVNSRSVVARDSCTIIVEVEGEWYECWRNLKTKEVYGTKISNRKITVSLHRLNEVDKHHINPSWKFVEMNPSLSNTNNWLWRFECPCCGRNLFVKTTRELSDICDKCYHHISEWDGG